MGKVFVVVAVVSIICGCAGNSESSSRTGTATDMPTPTYQSVYRRCMQQNRSESKCEVIAHAISGTPVPQSSAAAETTQSSDIGAQASPTADVQAAQSSDDATQPSPAADSRAERQEAQHYWNGVLDNIAYAAAYTDIASRAVNQGDSVTASSALSKASDRAQAALMATENAPSGWDNVSSDLIGAAEGYKESIDGMRQYLDDDKPSEAADAQQKASDAASQMAQATDEARQHYRDMGGDPNALHGLDTKVRDVLAALDELSGP